MEWMLMPLQRYADFQGRSRRKEYWMFILFQVIVYVVLGTLMAVFGAFTSDMSGDPSPMLWPFIGVFAIFALGVFIPSLAVQVRRLHDRDMSGWWILIGIIPIINYVGSIVLLVFYCLDGTPGPNRYGPDPKGGNNLEQVFS